MFLNTLAHTVSSFCFCFVFQVWKCTQGGRSKLSNFTGRQLLASSRSSGEGWSVLSTQHRPTAKTNRTPESQQPLCVLYCPDAMPRTARWFWGSEYKVKMPTLPKPRHTSAQTSSVPSRHPHNQISQSFPICCGMSTDLPSGDLSCVCLLGPWLPSL